MSTSALTLVLALATAGPASTEVEGDATDPKPIIVDMEPVNTTGSARSTEALTPDRAERIRAYQSQRLNIRDETELRGGSSGLASPLPGPMSSTNVIVVDSFYAVPTWGAYRGAERLSPADFLRETGESFRADDLDRRVERDRRKARRWMILAGTGAAGLTAGVVTYDRADDLAGQLIGQQLTFGGLAMGTTGLVAASFPASRATRLTHYPSAVMKRADAEDMARRHNRALQQELGLTPEDILLIELSDSL